MAKGANARKANTTDTLPREIRKEQRWQVKEKMVELPPKLSSERSEAVNLRSDEQKVD
jgi:hypothetical protein